MDDLLPYFERELSQLRSDMERFAERYPGAAARLSITGGQSADPHVERLLQSFALLAAGIHARLDDNYPEFTEALLNTVYPEGLRPFPSCSIAWFDAQHEFDRMTAPARVPRGTVFSTKTGHCRFRTVYDVTVAPLRIAAARYVTAPAARASIKLPDETSGVLSVTLDTANANFDLSAIPRTVRIHLHGQGSTTGAVVDAMLLHTAAAFAEGDDGRWTALPGSPLADVGFDAKEELLDGADGRLPFRLLSEYFAFPAKFNFVDLDLSMIVAAASAKRRVTLHFAVCGVPRDSWTEQRLLTCSSDTFRLFCTPVVNLFEMQALQAKRDEETGMWPVSARKGKGRSAEVWSVNAVSYWKHTGAPGDGRQTIPPFASLSHGDAVAPGGPYWVLKQQRDADDTLQTKLALVGLDGEPVVTGIEQLGVDLTCTNGSHAHQLPTGLPGGDLKREKGVPIQRIALLSKPTAPARLPLTGDAAWKIVAQLTPHSLQLSGAGLDSVKGVLRQFAALSTERTDFIGKIALLGSRAKNMLVLGDPAPSIVRGLELTLTLDEYAFAGRSLVTFAAVMERFFASYLTNTTYIELVLRSSNTGTEIRRGTPRVGRIEVL